MLKIWLYSLLSVTAVSTVSLIGIFTLSINEERLKRMVLYLVSFSVGSLFGGAFIHLLPEAFENLGGGLSTSLSIVAGILLFFVLEKVLRWRHCHVHTSEEDHVHPMVATNLVGDFLHNLIDGMIIGVSYMVSIPIGVTATVAVLLHEIPQEIGDFGVLIHGGLPVRKAILFNFISALAAIVGVVIALILGQYVENFAVALLPITAGGFIYIAGSDLIPELHHKVDLKTSLIQLVMIILGTGVMALLTLIEV